MFCFKCGTQNGGSAAFCSNCGASLQPNSTQQYNTTTTFQQSELPPDIPNYLTQAILVTLFCCLPFGIVAIVNAAQVNTKIAVKDYAGARLLSQKART